jgi:hypothetical protein
MSSLDDGYEYVDDDETFVDILVHGDMLCDVGTLKSQEAYEFVVGGKGFENVVFSKGPSNLGATLGLFATARAVSQLLSSFEM